MPSRPFLVYISGLSIFLFILSILQRNLLTFQLQNLELLETSVVIVWTKENWNKIVKKKKKKAGTFEVGWADTSAHDYDLQKGYTCLATSCVAKIQLTELILNWNVREMEKYSYAFPKLVWKQLKVHSCFPPRQPIVFKFKIVHVPCSKPSHHIYSNTAHNYSLITKPSKCTNFPNLFLE